MRQKKNYTIRKGRSSDWLPPQKSIYEDLFNAYDKLDTGERFVIEDDLPKEEHHRIYQAFKREWENGRFTEKPKMRVLPRNGKLTIIKGEVNHDDPA